MPVSHPFQLEKIRHVLQIWGLLIAHLSSGRNNGNTLEFSQFLQDCFREFSGVTVSRLVNCLSRSQAPSGASVICVTSIL